MSFFDILILDIILMLFPISTILLIKAYTKNVGKISKDYLIDIANFSSAFLLIQNCHTDTFYDVVLVNVPFVISILYNRKYASVLLAFILVLFNSSIGNSVFVVMIEYLIYIIMFFVLTKRNISYKNLLLIFIFIKGVSLTIGEYYVLGNNNILCLFQIFICLIAFYLIGVVVVKIINNIESTINFNVTLKELEKEKNLKNSLFKITHEVKNPIAVCKGYLTMMDPENVNQVKKYSEIILGEINRTLDIMDNFSEYTKIKVNLDIMDLDSLVVDVVRSMDMLFKEHDIVLEYSFDDEVYINGDYLRLKQVLINILKNSVEAISSAGKITISLDIKDDFVLLKIKDNGMGISKEELNKIGELFYSTKDKGCGIGVSLSKEIIKLHNGEMRYKSVLGKYTEVIIKFPLVGGLQ